MRPDLSTRLGPVDLRTPLVAASGTFGSIVEFKQVADLKAYGAVVSKSVSPIPWAGQAPPRLAPAGPGMLNSIGIQNPGIAAWVEAIVPRLEGLEVPVWGSAVGRDPGEFVTVATAMEAAGIGAIELNLSCPNLEEGRIFALSPPASAEVVAAVRERVGVPVSAKLSPNAEDIVAVARACVDAGADWLILTNTAWGGGIDVKTGRPRLAGVVGGYSGAGLKPISLRCVMEVHRALPQVPILGCGGVATGHDVVEYLMAGAAAVGVGTVHFAEPRAGARILGETEALLRKLGHTRVADLVVTPRVWAR